MGHICERDRPGGVNNRDLKVYGGRGAGRSGEQADPGRQIAIAESGISRVGDDPSPEKVRIPGLPHREIS